jgi:hypothetical protein
LLGDELRSYGTIGGKLADVALFEIRQEPQ